MSQPSSPDASARKTSIRSRFAQVNDFIDAGIIEAGLTPAAALVWLVLWRFADPKGIVTLSVDRISECTGLNRRTVMRSTASLRKARMLKEVTRGGINRGASKYRIIPLPAIKRVP